MLIDTHAHIQFEDYRHELDEVLDRAQAAGVEKILLVGVDELNSAVVGLHPHQADRGYEALEEVARLAEMDKVVAIGECGLDYSRSETSHEDQERALRFQIELALERDLPMVFHVRDAFDDFFHILDDYEGVRGLIHCFTAGTKEMQAAVDRGLYIALNGIMTFTKDEQQLEAARQVPLDRLVLETDCPFLTPAPKRGQRNEPANVALTAQFLAKLRDEPLEDLEAATTNNAERLFRI
jgi:TatD DNase family protein